MEREVKKRRAGFIDTGLAMIGERHGRPHIGANGVSDPLEKWMKNEKGKQAEESGFLNGVGWGEVIRVIMFVIF